MTPWVGAADVQQWIGVDLIDLESAASLALVTTSVLHDYIERDLVLTTLAVEYYDTVGTDFILLNRWPVRSIGGVAYQGQMIQPATGYGSTGWVMDPVNARKLCFQGMGKLARCGRAITLTNIVTGYDMSQPTGGVNALPGRILQALQLTAAAIFNAQAADPNLSSESTAGVFSGSFHAGGVGSIPPGAASLLAGEKRVAP